MIGGVSYHELAVNDRVANPDGSFGPTLSPEFDAQKRNQTLLIGVIGAAVLVYQFVISGGFVPVTAVVGSFPGGTYVHKFTSRDYSSSHSLAEQIHRDVIDLDERFKNISMIDNIYMMYLDNPSNIPNGRLHRFATGFLIPNSIIHDKTKKLSDNDKTKALIPEKLLELNKKMNPLTAKELKDLGAFSLWPRLPYYKHELPPSSKALVCNFPFTDGVASSLMFSLKVFPKLYKLAEIEYRKQNVDSTNDSNDNFTPVIVATCGATESVCTFYVILENLDFFWLGHTPSSTYINNLPKSQSYNQPAIDIYNLFFRKTTTSDEL